MFLDGLYTVEKRSTDKVTVKLSDRKHKVFQAHFPKNPILPAFVHLEIISDVFTLDITSVKKAKFSEKVIPLDTLIYVKVKNKIEVFCKEKCVAHFIL